MRTTSSPEFAPGRCPATAPGPKSRSTPVRAGLTPASPARDAMTDTPTQTAMPTPEHYGPDAHPPAEGPHELFIVPARSGTHFQANIGGRMLDLADPGSTDWVAPTPDDLFVA